MPSQRKKKFVHFGIQGTLVLRMSAQWLAFIAVLAAVSVLMQLVMDPLASAEDWQLQVKITLVSLGLVSLALLPMFIWDIIKFSHRFVGPIVRLQSHIRVLHDTDARPVDFRADDYWQDLAGDFNAMLDRLRDRSQTHEEQEIVAAARD